MNDKSKSINSTEISAGEGEIKFDSPKIKDGIYKRRSPWASSYSALQYVSTLSRKNFRKSDTVSDILVCLCVLCAVVLIFVPPKLLTPPVILGADIIFFAVTFYFVLKRLGILITLSARQAILVWDIVVGSFLLGILLCFNVMLFITYMTLSPG
jgi:hypothetical protein